MGIYVIGLSHHTAPVAIRERMAIGESAIPETLARLRASGLADEAVILSTCNRVELYAASSLGPGEALPGLRRFLLQDRGIAEPLTDEVYAWADPRSVEHLFRVACGLDSMVLGETEILGQLKKAYEIALERQHTGGRLNKTFQRAFNVAKQIRTETQIQRGSISVASVAVELAEKIFESLGNRQVMVIGAGDTSEKVARALLSRGAHSVLVSNRSFDRAEALARELGGQAIHFDAWAGAFDRIDIVISSTSAPHHVIDPAKLHPLMKARDQRPLLLIDIAVPRDIDPAVNFMDNVYLYNVDDLQSIADGYLQQRREEIEACMAIIRDRARALLEGRRPPGFPPSTQPVLSGEP
ncbi:MAG: glutamyl-tRNA reductase [Verrucomicrobia bacterium]|nr:glutamyl-tRNA reductase [Verrucomicrobiota bacterium]MBI3870122.1 glutamyl-tRNA reductase [Verrucomicrobiota bacterium]